ncbi:putative F-box domain, galactose oxidase/kelch, beta-propeller, F-box associated interaction [Helianthus annuus]|nr:putative F-box domain, galactose oxidase/kelch, beta-propeller, F-box associated interaction [Helianthus annuus]
MICHHPNHIIIKLPAKSPAHCNHTITFPSPPPPYTLSDPIKLMASEDSIEIPPEIITNILHRLPSKPLTRFKTVSKNWQSLISDPQFIKHHQKTLNRRHLICDIYNTPLYSFPINPHHQTPQNLTPHLPHTDKFTFHGSCNGLVLASADDFDGAHSLIVINPTTRECIQVPESGYDVVDKLLQVEIKYGFGYDPLTDDYKVVTVSYFHHNYMMLPRTMSVHVYSLRDNDWRRVGDSVYNHSRGWNLPGVFVNGVLHWVVGKGLDGLRVIVGFSLADETFSEVPSPEFGDRGDVLSKRECRLVVVGEKLGVFFEDKVWVMNEYGVRESWVKIVINGINKIRVVDPEILYEDGKILMLCGGLMWVYDVEEKCFREHIDICGGVGGVMVRGSYVESLVSPKFR